MKTKAQTWSFDVIIAVTVFIVAFVVFYGIISYAGTKPPAEALVDEGNLILKTMSSSNENSKAVIINNKIDQENLEDFARGWLAEDEEEGNPLEKQQEYLGTTDAFCVYLEDEDGNIIPIDHTDKDGNPIMGADGITPLKKYGIGSSEIEIGGEECGALV